MKVIEEGKPDENTNLFKKIDGKILKIKQIKVIEEPLIKVYRGGNPDETLIVKQISFQKILKIIQNNNSIYITTKTRHPELQNLYREAIINRFNKCILSDMDKEVCKASHIIPFSEC